MTSQEALTYAIERLRHEASVAPHKQRADVLQRKLDAIETLEALRELIGDQVAGLEARS